MTQKAQVTELLYMLLSIREQAEQTAQNINQIARNLSAERQSLQQMVNDYGARRVELLRQELQARGITWYTGCSEVIPESEAELLFVEGTEKYSHGYEAMYYGFRDFSKLHRVCPVCRERAADRHGQKGAYDLQAKNQSSYYAFRVERREDGYYARKFGDWVKLDEKNCSPDEMSNKLIERIAEEWNLPPRIKLILKESSYEVKLIISERVAVAETS
jgi:hypothetical protein